MKIYANLNKDIYLYGSSNVFTCFEGKARVQQRLVPSHASAPTCAEVTVFSTVQLIFHNVTVVL